MQIITPNKMSLVSNDPGNLIFQGSQGERGQLTVLEDDIVRVQFFPNGQPRLNRTWMVVDANGDMPREGRHRDDLSPFTMPDFGLTQTDTGLTISTQHLNLHVSPDSFQLSWADATGRPFAADLAGRAYPYDQTGKRIYHYLARRPDEHYYGFGERSGSLDKTGRRLRMLNLDAMGYNAESSDPLYKHFPFYITFIPSLNIAYGLFYDNLATTTFDMGQELDNYYGHYRYYQAEGGDIDYYFIFGPSIPDVVKKFSALTGRMMLPPRWSLGYLGSTMLYTEAADAQAQLKKFVDLCDHHQIPCDLFHLSSGYTTGADNKRYVFNWNLNRIPNPQAMTAHFHQAGIKLAANIKPCLLTSHPGYEEVKNLGAFVSTPDGENPELTTFWGGQGAHIDFTNPTGYNWWKQRVLDRLLDFDIDSTWNDNNEYPIWNDDARCHGFGDPLPMSLIRPIQSLLMAKASCEAQQAFKPHERPFLISRSGCPGIQRYAQTWSGDNYTSWQALRYNIPMGLGMSLSGAPNTGHDVGGFAGDKPDAELFVRWVQNGIFHPRFTIHSWNDDRTVNEPWMYPDVLPIVRHYIEFRYRLMPYLYTLIFQATQTGQPIIRPMVYHFPDDPPCYTESFDFMLGPNLLVASVLEAGARSREVYLPGDAPWCNFYTGEWYAGRETVNVDAPLDRIPLFVRAGGIIPMGKVMRYVGQQPDDVRRILVFPHPQQGRSQFTVIEDDGLSLDYQRGGYTQVRITVEATPEKIDLGVVVDGDFNLPYRELNFVLPPGEVRPLFAKYGDQAGTDDAGRRQFTIRLNGSNTLT